MAAHLLTDEYNEVPDEVLRTVAENFPFLVYAGSMDGSVCNHLGISRVVEQLDWSGKDEYAAAERKMTRIGSRVTGFERTAGTLRHTVILNSGHLVPTDQPEVAIDMIRRFVEDLVNKH